MRFDYTIVLFYTVLSLLLPCHSHDIEVISLNHFTRRAEARGRRLVQNSIDTERAPSRAPQCACHTVRPGEIVTRTRRLGCQMEILQWDCVQSV